MKKAYIIFLLLNVALLQGCFPKVVSAFYSKEYCSCRFVENKDHNECHWYAGQIIPVSSYEVDEKFKVVKSSALGFTSTAKWTNPQWGCLLSE